MSIHPLCRKSHLSASLVGPPTMSMFLPCLSDDVLRSMLQKVPGRAQGLISLDFLFLYGTAKPKTFKLPGCSLFLRSAFSSTGLFPHQVHAVLATVTLSYALE